MRKNKPRHNARRSKVQEDSSRLSASDSQQAASTAAGRTAVYSIERLRPWLLAAVVALYVACPLVTSESSGRGGEMLPAVMLALILATIWTAAHIGCRRWRLRLEATDVAVLVLVAWHSLAALLAVKYGHPRPAINMLWLWIGLALGYFLLRQLLHTQREVRAVATVMIGLAVLLSVDGLWQYAYEFPAMRAEYAKNPDTMLREQGMWYPPGSPQRTQFDNRLASREPLATFALTNSLAGYLAPWLVFSVGIALAAGRRRFRLAVAAAVIALLIAACLVLTKSRSAYIAVTLGLFAIIFFLYLLRRRVPWKPLVIAVTVVSLLVATALVVGGLDVEVFNEAGKSLGYRCEYWRSTAEMIADHPFFGCGPGQFQNTYTRYKLPQASEEIADPHNFLIEIWATAGTPAALALLAVLVCFLWSIIKRNTKSTVDGRQVTGDRRQGTDAGQQEVMGDISDESKQLCAAAWVLGGAFAGLLVAWPLGLLVAMPPNVVIYFLAAPLGIVAVVFLRDWIDNPLEPLACSSGQQRFSVRSFSALAAICLLVMLINLSAAGGIGFAGVAGSFWLLLAMGLFRESNAKSHEFGPIAAPLLTAVLVVLSLVCYFSAYRPVLTAQSHIQAALSNLADPEEHLLAAANADSFAAQPLRQLAAVSFEQWKKTKNPQDLDNFKRYISQALKIDSASSYSWRTASEHYLDLYEFTHNKADLEQAVRGLRKAIELYPNDATTRAIYSLALRMAGKEKESEKQAKIAINLDELTPHADHKIPKPLRLRLIDSRE